MQRLFLDPCLVCPGMALASVPTSLPHGGGRAERGDVLNRSWREIGSEAKGGGQAKESLTGEAACLQVL